MNPTYRMLLQQADELTKNVPHLISNLANISALLYSSLENINWAGFYLISVNSQSANDSQSEKPDHVPTDNIPGVNTISEKPLLILGPFQGNPACIEIPFGKGVCGTAAAEDKTQLVPDVHLFPGHIACDSASRSEIVIPIHKDGRVFCVLDIDSPLPGRFTGEDQIGLESLVRLLERNLF